MNVTAPSPEIAKLLATAQPSAEAIVGVVRAAVLGADPRIEEGIKWNAPSYHVGGAHFATFHLRSKAGVQLVLHLGAKPRVAPRVRAEVADPTRLLEWKSADRAVITIPTEAAAHQVQKPLTALVRQWIEHL